jgi:hypothetical protein
MSSDEDLPAPSPSAAVVARLVARRASREAKSMREESGSPAAMKNKAGFGEYTPFTASRHGRMVRKVPL